MLRLGAPPSFGFVSTDHRQQQVRGILASAALRDRRLHPAQERARHAKASEYSYRDRRNRKRDMRSLWILRINAAAHLHGLNYSEFVHQMYRSGVWLDRKHVSSMAVENPGKLATTVLNFRPLIER